MEADRRQGTAQLLDDGLSYRNRVVAANAPRRPGRSFVVAPDEALRRFADASLRFDGLPSTGAWKWIED